MAAIPKTERILNLISFLLKSRRPVSWRRIRQEVEGYNDPAERDASVERRFERDKATLRELGIAVQHAPGDTDIPADNRQTNPYLRNPRRY